MQTVYKMEYREGSVRPIATWSPPRVRTALHLLQTGNFSQAAHLADAILGDGRVQAVLGTRINGVLGLPFTVDPADDSSGAAAIAEAAGKDFWGFFPEDASGELMRYGLMLGAVAAELVWVFEAGRLLPKLKVWHPSNLRYNSETQTYAVRLESGVEHPITPGDGKWLLYTPHSSRRPWTLALVRALAVPWLSKQFAAGDWNGYSEQLGKGVLKGGVPASARPEDKEDFKNDLRNLGTSGVVITPEGFTAELLEGRGQGWQTFESLIAWADKETAVTVLGQNLTTDVSGGSLAAAKVHENVRQDFLEADTETLATSLHEQVFTWYAEFNFGDRKLAPWPHWDAEPPADSKTEAETDKAKGEALTAIAAGARAAGVGHRLGSATRAHGYSYQGWRNATATIVV